MKRGRDPRGAMLSERVEILARRGDRKYRIERIGPEEVTILEIFSFEGSSDRKYECLPIRVSVLNRIFRIDTEKFAFHDMVIKYACERDPAFCNFASQFLHPVRSDESPCPLAHIETGSSPDYKKNPEFPSQFYSLTGAPQSRTLERRDEATFAGNPRRVNTAQIID